MICCKHKFLFSIPSLTSYENITEFNEVLDSLKSEVIPAPLEWVELPLASGFTGTLRVARVGALAILTGAFYYNQAIGATTAIKVTELPTGYYSATAWYFQGRVYYTGNNFAPYSIHVFDGKTLSIATAANSNFMAGFHFAISEVYPLAT